MRRFGLLLFILVNLSNVSGQYVKVLSQVQDIEKHEVTTIDVIDSSFNLDGHLKLATLIGTASNTNSQNIRTLFDAIWDKANRLGGNAFKLDSIWKSSESTSVFLSIYYLSEEGLKKNLASYPENKIYIFGEKEKQKPGKTIHINSQEFVLNPMEYISYQNKVEEKTIISIGEFLGSGITIIGKEGKPPVYVSTDRIWSMQFGYNNASINSRKFCPVDLNLGQFLVQVLKEQR